MKAAVLEEIENLLVKDVDEPECPGEEIGRASCRERV